MKFLRIFPIVFCLLAAGCESAPETDIQENQAVEATDTQEKPATTDKTLGPVHARVTLSNESPRLGSQITLTLSVDSEPGVTVTMPEFGDQLQLGKFNIADYKQTESLKDDGRNEYTQSYTLDLPMSGRLRTPSFLIEFTDNRDGSEEKGNFQELLTDEISFEVASVFADGEIPENLYPVKDVLPELVLPETSKKSPLPWILLALALLAGVGAVIYLKTRKKSEMILPPDVVALTELKAMSSDDIPTEREKADAWYVRLSSVVRNYLEGRFGLQAPRLTTEEFFELMKKNDTLSYEHKQLLKKLLEQSDMVKFADFIPTCEQSKELLENAISFVEETRPVENEEEANKASA